MTTSTAPAQRAASGDPLLVTLAGVAEIAQVSRPVASMWRTRFAMGDDAFPAPVGLLNGADAFDAAEVASWLERTAHGNNSEAAASAAAVARPADLSFADPRSVAEIEALILLHAQHEVLAECSADELRDIAVDVDADDLYLRREIEAHADRGAPWLDYVGRLVDAAYSAPAALRLVARRSAPSGRSAASAGRLSGDCIALVTEATLALANASECAVTLDSADAELSAAMAAALGDKVTLVLPVQSEARRVRRRLIADDVWLTEPVEAAAFRTVTTARLPAARGDDIAAMLRAVNEIALTLREDDAAVVIGPARALTDELAPTEERLRNDVLRTGRVRGVARLTVGLVESAPRESLAVWVLGAPLGDVPIRDRFTVVADLTNKPLTPATRTDLVADIMVSMGSAREVRAHAFRFARFTRTAHLLARGGSLASLASPKSASQPNAVDLPTLIDTAAEKVRADLAPIAVGPANQAALTPRSVTELIQDGHLRRITGTRLDPALLGATGLIVVTADDLDRPAAIGALRVDQLAFATRYPNATLTRPGDVIFRTAPTAAAWVDLEGFKVVAAPARVLRITAGDPGGLVPEVVAADITGGDAGPAAWRRWMLRRVAPPVVAPLRQALADIGAARADLEARAASLDHYARLVVAGTTSGAIAFIDSNPAADAAATQ